MSTPYPDVEGQLYTTGPVDAPYTEAEARQRAATAREVEAAVSAAGASALAGAKTYTDQKVTGLATTAAMNAADALTLSNAKAYTDSQLADFDSFVGVPIFETLAEAAAWEAANPGKRALTLEPSTPDTVAPTWNATLTTATPNGGTVVITASTLASDDRAVTGYKYSLDAGATWAAVTPSAGRKFTITGLEGETAYSSVFLRAEDAAGNVKALAVPTFTTPATLAPAPTDFTYQWLGSSLSGTSWTDSKAGLTLTRGTPATTSGDAAVFAGGGGYSGTGAAMTSKEAAYVVVSKLATLEDVGAFLFGANDNASRVITSPDFAEEKRLYGTWKKTGGVIGLDTNWHVAVFRWSATPDLNDMWVDGLRYSMTPRNDASVVNTTKIKIGGDGANNYKGSIREVQMFNRYVSDGEAKSIIADLRTKYGIA